jgi:hypothetical protein
MKNPTPSGDIALAMAAELAVVVAYLERLLP